MPLQLTPSRACIAFVERFEGLRRRAARTSAGGWTIGYGHTLTAREGAQVSADDAEALLTYDLREVARTVGELVFTPLHQNQVDALAAFAFNIGADAFRRSEVLRRVNAGDHLGAAFALERWRAAEIEGEPLIIDGLVRRRAAEKALYLTPPDGFRPTPSSVLRPLLDASSGDPVDARAGRAAEIDTALDAEAPHLGAHVDPEPARPEVTLAAEEVSARLRERFPEPVGSPAPEVDTLPAEFEPGPFPSEDNAASSPVMSGVVRQPAPIDVHGLEPDAPPFPEEAEGMFPHALDPAASDQDIAPEEPVTERGSAGAETFVEEARAAGGKSSRSRTPWLIGLVGLALFGVAIVSMIRGPATLLNLAAGLAGVFCLAYAAATLLLPWLHRPAERD